MKVLVIGYFNKNNLGDDLFLYIWQVVLKHIPNVTADFLAIEEMERVAKNNVPDTIILAGGNLLLNYFSSKILKFIDRVNYQGKIIGYSLAIPFKGFCVTSQLLNKMHYISCRSRKDTKILNLCYDKDIIDFAPDISIYLPEILEFYNYKSFQGLQKYKYSPETKYSVGVFLTRPICKSKNYAKIVQTIAECLDEIANKKIFEIFLIPFDTNETSTVSNDILINNDVYTHIQNKDFIHNVTERFTVEEMYYIFKNQLDINITMRFHSVMYSVLADVPFIPMFTTNKIKELVQDIDYPVSYELPVDHNLQPTDLDKNTLLTHFFNVWNNNKNKCKTLIEQYKKPKYELHEFIKDIQSKLTDESLQVMTRENSLLSIISIIVNYIYSEVNTSTSPPPSSPNDDVEELKQQDIKDIYARKKTFHDILERKLTPKEKHKYSSDIATLICFLVLKDPLPTYHYGLCEKVLLPSFTLHKDLEWIWNDHIQNTFDKNDNIALLSTENQIFTQKKPLFNMNYVHTSDMKGLHRSGWQFVVNNLKQYHSDDSPLIFDNYIDRTFHWNEIIYKFTNIIPFKSKWCGVLHHTFDTSFSDFNLNKLFQNPVFIESLDTCVALFTLSSYLANQVHQHLKSINVIHIKIFNLIHPTEVPTLCFDIKSFHSNPEKKLVHIGGWLRNNYTIYALQPMSKHVHKLDYVNIQKYKLQGKNMESYIKPPNMDISFSNVFNDSTYSFNYSKDIIPSNMNKYASGLLDYIYTQQKSVTILETLSDNEYDELLSQNIVFLDLIDASAVNTVIECIVRCTPILINPLPAIVEVLGKDYPFYYNDLSEANYLASHFPSIKKTYEYLLNLNKDKFTVEYFLINIEKSISSLMI